MFALMAVEETSALLQFATNDYHLCETNREKIRRTNTNGESEKANSGFHMLST